MFRTFIDESGNDARDPLLVVAAWVGKVEAWEQFSNEWLTALEAGNPKPLTPFQGQIYFKHSEARAREKCFSGFSDSEAELKTTNLARVITHHDVGALAFVLYRQQYFQIVEEMVVKKSGRLYQDYINDPLFIALHHLVGLVLGTQYVENPHDKVDFILDGKAGSGPTNRVISMYEFTRSIMPGWFQAIMGTAIPMNDIGVMPLQASDLLAGQIRMASQYRGHPAPLLLLRRHNRNWIRRLDETSIRIFLSQFNVAVSTRRLSAIANRREAS
jgi:hypothetical protein